MLIELTYTYMVLSGNLPKLSFCNALKLKPRKRSRKYSWNRIADILIICSIVRHPFIVYTPISWKNRRVRVLVYIYLYLRVYVCIIYLIRSRQKEYWTLVLLLLLLMVLIESVIVFEMNIFLFRVCFVSEYCLDCSSDMWVWAVI